MKVVIVEDTVWDLNELRRRCIAEGMEADWDFHWVNTKRDQEPAQIAQQIAELVGRSEAVVFMDVVLQEPSDGVPVDTDAIGIDVASELQALRPDIAVVGMSKYESDRDTYLGVIREPAFVTFVPKKILKLLSREKFKALMEGVIARDRVRRGISGGDGRTVASLEWAILTAKVDERNAVAKVLSERGAEQREGRWRLRGADVGLFCAGEQGLVHASLMASEAIWRRGAKRVLLTGMCAVVPGGGSVYDVFVPRLAKLLIWGKLENGQLKPRTGGERAFAVSTEDLDEIRRVCAPRLAALMAGRFEGVAHSPSWHEEPIGSSDLLNLDRDYTRNLLDVVAEDVRAVDMEAFAVAMAGELFGVPSLVVKVASDPLGDRQATKRVACEVAALASVCLLEAIIGLEVHPRRLVAGRA